MKAMVTLAAGLLLGLVPAVRAGCEDNVPPANSVQAFHVHFGRTRGVGDFEGFPDLDLDAKQLSAEEVKDLRKLIENAGFFDLKSSPTPQLGIPDPPAGYDLTVEMDGRSHAIWVTDWDVSKSLQPLIRSLTKRAQEKSVKVHFAKSGGIAGIHWTSTTKEADLSAEDARQLRKLIADARFFELPENMNDTHVADGFGYTITVEMDGKRHTVDVAEDAAPKALLPLIQWLSDRPGQDR